jgi:predicted nucleic acid-binding protein
MTSVSLIVSPQFQIASHGVRYCRTAAWCLWQDGCGSLMVMQVGSTPKLNHPQKWQLEYESVILRPGLVPGFTADEHRRIVDGLCQLADHQQVFFAWRPFLPDPDDDLVLELAVAASAKFVITHNISDFRGSESMGVRAITPATTLNMIGP